MPPASETRPATRAARFSGCTAVVAGAGEDVGRATAELLAAEGATVVAVDAAGDDLRGTCERVAAAGGTAVPVELDLGDPEAVMAAGERLRSSLDRVDVLVNGQMHQAWTTIEASAIETWVRAFAVNAIGPVAMVKAFLPLLRRSPRAAVVHVGSVDGTQGNPRVPTYSASKGALVPLTHVMASELGPGIRVNCVARVGSAGHVTADYAARLASFTPLGRLVEPVELAMAIAFLASEDASYVDGTVLVVDGGRTGITPGTA